MPEEKAKRELPKTNLLAVLYLDKAFEAVLKKPWLVLIEILIGLQLWIYILADPRLLVFSIIAVLGALGFTIVNLKSKIKPPQKKEEAKASAWSAFLVVFFLISYFVTGFFYAALMIFFVFLAVSNLASFFNNIWLAFTFIPAIMVFSLLYNWSLKKHGEKQAERIVKAFELLIHGLMLCSLAIVYLLG